MMDKKTGVSGHRTHKATAKGGKGLPKKAMKTTASAGPKKSSSSVHSHSVMKKHAPVKKAK